jgi:hypothetical protein
MEQKRYKELEEKYWRGETSVFEEEELYRATQIEGSDVSPQLRAVLGERKTFAEINAGESFEEDFWKKADDNEISIGKRYQFSTQFIRVAAAVVFILGSVLIWNSLQEENLKPTQSAQLEDSFDDPQEAYEETRKALLFVSAKLNKGKEPVKEIKRFHDSKLTILGADNHIDNKDKR